MSEESNKTSYIIAHIEMMQGIIGRMSKNSAACKNWTITIVSAILVLYFEESNLYNTDLRIGYIPTGLFFFLDCYYLGHERYIIKQQKSFIKKINNKDDISKELFLLRNDGDCAAWRTIKAVWSFSTLPFYGIILLMFFYLINY